MYVCVSMYMCMYVVCVSMHICVCMECVHYLCICMSLFTFCCTVESIESNDHLLEEDSQDDDNAREGTTQSRQSLPQSRLAGTM